MRSSVGLSIAVLLAAAAASAQEAGGGPQESPAPNINYGGNPTAPAQLPSTYTGNPIAPTYPAAADKPASRGGSVGDDPDKRRDGPDPTHEKAKKLERERALPEPNELTHTGSPPGTEASPGVPEDVNPGSVLGGPQP